MHVLVTAKRLILSFMAVMILSCVAMTQPVTTSTLQETDSVKTVDGESSHSLFSGLGYGNNMIYLGSSISQNSPYSYAALTYGFKDELYVTASAIHLAGRKPVGAFYNFSLNYSHVINSWFDFALGVYRYEVVPSLKDTLFGSFTYGEATFGTDWRLIYTRISYVGVFMKDGGSYLQVRNSRYFETPEFNYKKFYVSFDPYVNLLFGTLITTETTAVTEEPGGTHTKPPWAGIPHSSKNTGTGTSTTNYSTKFGLAEIDIGLPVALNSDHFSAEVETSFVLPLYKDPYYPDIKGFVFLLTVYYRIF